MRVIFLIVLLCGALFYSYIAFENLNFLTRTGRLGPGFFPRMIGVSATILVLWALLEELRRPSQDDETEAVWQDVVVLMALAVGYAVLLRLFGGFVSTVIFLAVALSILNKGQHLRNAITAVLVPVAIYLLFDKVLNASMPPALFDLIPL